MTNKICKLHRMERREVFMKIINEMKKAGWQQLNDDKPNKNNIFVMYSTGNDGTKNNYIELRPYDSNIKNSQLSSAFDIRDPNVVFADGSYRLIRGYDKDGGIGTGEEVWFPLVFLHGKANYTSGPTNINYKEYMVDLYLYADKDSVIYCVYANDDEIPSEKGRTTIGFLGLPDESYQPELFSPYSTSFSVLLSGGAYGDKYAHVTDNSKFARSSINSRQISTFFWDKVFLKAPSNEGKMVLTPLYIGNNVDGFRGKYDGFYIYKGSGYIYGDILEVIENNEVQKYKLFYTYGSTIIGSQYNSFNEFAVALRIE
ncbi:hypothetical protein CN286_15500 [Bacillus anthracis]|nr:hypothetical protein CN286_15500 [Bacillus anthracis]